MQCNYVDMQYYYMYMLKSIITKHVNINIDRIKLHVHILYLCCIVAFLQTLSCLQGAEVCHHNLLITFLILKKKPYIIISSFNAALVDFLATLLTTSPISFWRADNVLKETAGMFKDYKKLLTCRSPIPA